MDIFKLGDKILALLEAVFGFWNNQISLVFAMLGQSPVSFKGGGPWAVIEGIEPLFVAVGSSLVVLFFVIGFCSESIDVKDEMRFESILRMLIRLGLAEWFVANNVTIMKAFFTSIGNLVGLISAGTTTQLAIDSTQADIIKGLGFGESLVMLILTALLAIIIIICGFFIIYTVYFRFLKILIIVPLGAIACSTMAGNRMVSHTMATYCKYFLSLELFVNGSLNIFNHQTNVDVDNRFTVYGIRDLGTELSPITMLVMMESIQNRIVENGKRGKATWLYIDEFHVLLNSEYSAKYLQQLWKKVRKQGGLCTGITQNVVDLLQNYTATTMLANSEFVALLKQANTDSSKMAEVIGVSEAQLRFVTNTASGMGLIKCGSVVIPFDNQISKDTDLYRLYNTNIHEKIAEQKKKEAMLQ